MTRWIAGFVCAIALMAAGCGGAPEPARPAEPPAATPAPTPAPTPEAAPPATPAEKPATPAETPAPSTEKPATTPPADTAKPAATEKPAVSAEKYGPGVYAHFTTNHGDDDREVVRQGSAEDGREFRRACRRQEAVAESADQHDGAAAVLQQPDVPSHHPWLHDSGWRSRRHRHGRARFRIRRRIQPEASPQQSRASCRWRTEDPTPTADSSSSRWCRRRISTTDTAYSASSSKEWTHSRAIGKVPTKDKGGMPVKPVIIKSVRIERVSG